MKNILNIKILLPIIGILLISSCNRSPSIEWEKEISWETLQDLIDVKQTDDGGYIILGKSPDSPLTLVKLDSAGNTLWIKPVLERAQNFGKGIELSNNGGYMLVGYHYLVKTNKTTFWVAKLDKKANVIWSKEYTDGNNQGEVVALKCTNEGNYIVVGHRKHYISDSVSDYWISKIDNDGELIWSKALGGSDNDIPHLMRKTKNGNYVVEGMTYSIDGDVPKRISERLPYSIWSVEVNDNGDLVNSQRKQSININGKTALTDDGEYLFAGQEWVGDLDGSVDLVLEKRNSNLNLVWSKTITSPGKDESIKILQTNNKGCIVLARGPYVRKVIKLGY